MMQYSWPGNIRELQNVVERAAILAQGPVLDLSGTVLGDSTPAVPEPSAFATVPLTTDPASLDDVQRLHIINVLKQTGGVVEGVRGAATILGVHPNTLRSRMKKLGISVAQA